MLETTISVLRCLHPRKSVELWFEDEARLGLQPTTRRQWALKGHRPIAPSDTVYQWLYAYAFIQPMNGESMWLLLPTVNSAIMSKALEEFVKEVDPKKETIILLVIDGAGFHVAKNMVIPENIVLRYLPSHTPELQPVEAVWPLLREATHNRHFKTLKCLQDTLIHRCTYLLDHQNVVQERVNFSWISHVLKK